MPPMTVRTLYLGTSGFAYDEWKGPFYPLGLKQREMLPALPIAEGDLHEPARDQSSADQHDRDEEVVPDEPPAPGADDGCRHVDPWTRAF